MLRQTSVEACRSQSHKAAASIGRRPNKVDAEGRVHSRIDTHGMVGGQWMRAEAQTGTRMAQTCIGARSRVYVLLITVNLWETRHCLPVLSLPQVL